MRYSTRVKLNGVLHVLLVFAVYLAIFYCLWLIRKIENGQLLTGMFVALFFGLIWIYLARAWEVWIKYKSKVQVLLNIICAGFCANIWVTILKALAECYVTGEVCPVARDNFVGLFGLTGFWAFSVGIPIYLCMVLLVWFIMSMWEHYDLT